MSLSFGHPSGSRIITQKSELGCPVTPSPLKRKRSKISVDTPSPTRVDVVEMSTSQPGKRMPYQLSLSTLPSIHTSPDLGPDIGPPSPVPTEIIDQEGEDFVRTAKQYGVKVRDFAHEDPKPGVGRVPEVWRDPFISLLSHDMHIRRPSETCFELPGKILRRLLDVGLVTQEEAKRHWTSEDWQRLEGYEARPNGPHPFRVAIKRPKPSCNYRAAARIQFYGDPLPTDIPDSDIYVPEDGPEVWDGDEATDEMGETMKKRRLASSERKKSRALARSSQNARVQQRQESTSQPPAESQSVSQAFEYSQVANPISQTASSEIPDVIATPPSTPVALPEGRRGLVRSPSIANITSSSSSFSPSGNGNGASTTSRSRRISRTETLSLLLVQ
ncbi:hypothetical protein BDW22DRAFT_1362480 [Trametopsis cervina]|nr:hypothetical protein BDW22DRAFT_1362480 [Trametopsis cervina]